MSGFENDVLVAKNVNFDNTGPKPHLGIITANGQLLIGSAVAPFIVANTLTAGTGIAITNGPGSITIGLSGSGVAVEHLTANTGGQLNPDGSNNFNILGTNSALTGFSPWITGSGSTLTVNSPGIAKWIVNPVAGLGTHTTIASALTSASSGETIFITPGTYTENLTLKAGVNLCAFDCDALTPNVTILGKLTYTQAGTISISGIRLQTNSDFFLAVTGSSASIVNLIDCYLNCSNNTGVQYSTSSGSAKITIRDCFGNIGTTGISLFTSTSSGNIEFYNCNFTNSGSSTTSSTTSSASVNFFGSVIAFPLTTSGTGAFQLFFTFQDTSATNTIGITTAGTGTSNVYNSYLTNGNAASASIGAGTIFDIYDSIVNSSAANPLTGAGTISYNGIVFQNTGAGINVTTQNVVQSNNTIPRTATSASPYTVLSTDYFISVDCSAAAKQVNLPNSASLNQIFIVKDRTGSAATHNITVTTPGGIVNIDGATTYVISVNYGSASFIWNGTSYEVF